MSLNNGRQYLAIPGPSVMPDRVLAAMHRPAPNIYEGPLHDMVDTILADLKVVARTKGHAAIYIGNGHAAWEAALVNSLSRGDKVLVPATGAFGLGWADAARGLGIDIQMLDFGRERDIDLSAVEAALRQDKDHKIKAVLATHVDTASAVRNDIAALRNLIDLCGHPALLMVDCIASLACDPVEMDAWGVDVMIAASQKGLMTPPGLAFVWFNDKANHAHKSAGLVTPYWNWTDRCFGTRFSQKFDGTAPTHHLFGLREALNMLLHEEGMDAVFARHQKLASAVWAAVDTWSTVGPVRLNIKDAAKRSCAVTSVRIGAPLGTQLRRWTEHKAGVTLGIGLGMATPEDPNSDGAFRIAHMGHVNAHMVMGSLGVIEAGLQALNIPHGPGALAAAAGVIATA